MIKTTITILLVLMLNTTLNAAPEAWDIWDESDEESTEMIDHQTYAEILQRYLNNEHESGINRFAYKKVSPEDKDKLNNYIAELTAIDIREYNKDEQMAYWINLYNALTIEVILRKKPLFSILTTGNGLLSKGPWDDVVATIDDVELTLNDIEHRILRPIWNDYRIHFAVNCASIGCPNLQGVPFLAKTLETQLEQGANDYLNHPRGLKFKGDKLHLSEIFNWYAEDFGNNQTEILATLAKYVDEMTAEKLRSYKGKISYSYDWGLNK